MSNWFNNLRTIPRQGLVEFTDLLWPEFVEVQGCVLLKAQYSASAVEAWMAHTGGDVAAIEATMNRV